MQKIAVSDFKKLSIAKMSASLPLTVTSNGKPLFDAITSVSEVSNSFTNAELIQLIIGDDTDPVHIAQAQKRIADMRAGKIADQTKPSTVVRDTYKTGDVVDKPIWLGEWSGNVGDTVRSAVSVTKNISLFVLYNIPGRDNGNYSAGGLQDAVSYLAWVNQIANSIGNKRAIVILEPDALGLSESLNPDKQLQRLTMLNSAIVALKRNANTHVYIDISIWSGVDKSVDMLKTIVGVDGFSCNVSGYRSLSDCVQFAQSVVEKSPQKLRYVIDTSRNGNGAPKGTDIWCNQTGTKIGRPNTLINGTDGCDWYLWIKVPGESDGRKINGKDGDGKPEIAPPAGTMWPEYRDAIYLGDWTEFNRKYGI